MSFQKAVKHQAKLRLALCGLAGTGKSYTAFAIGTNLVPGGKVAVIDTERGSASLYANKFDFDVCELESFSPLAYVEKIKEAERAGYDVIIIDSLSHAWAGKDGALQQKDRVAEAKGNSWTAWRDVSPKHDALVDAMLQSKAHVIVTMRVKMEHVQETVNGKTEIKKVGLASIQREGMDYEMTLVGDLDYTHTLKISKTRIDGVIDVGDQFEKAGAALAKRLYAWLMDGAVTRPAAVEAPKVVEQHAEPITAPTQPSASGAKVDAAFESYLAAMSAAKSLADLDGAATGPAKPPKGTDEHKLATNHYRSCKALLEEQLQAAAS